MAEIKIDISTKGLDNAIVKFKEATCALKELNKEFEIYNKKRSKIKRLFKRSFKWIKTKYYGIFSSR